jgi:hypothetical protein
MIIQNLPVYYLTNNTRRTIHCNANWSFIIYKWPVAKKTKRSVKSSIILYQTLLFRSFDSCIMIIFLITLYWELPVFLCYLPSTYSNDVSIYTWSQKSWQFWIYIWYIIIIFIYIYISLCPLFRHSNTKDMHICIYFEIVRILWIGCICNRILHIQVIEKSLSGSKW